MGKTIILSAGLTHAFAPTREASSGGWPTLDAQPARSALARRVLGGGLRCGGLSLDLLGRGGAGGQEVVEVVLFAPSESVGQEKLG